MKQWSTFTHPVAVARIWWVKKRPEQYIAVQRQIFNCIGPFAGPFHFLGFVSGDIHQIISPDILFYSKVGAGKGPCSSSCQSYFPKASVIPVA